MNARPIAFLVWAAVAASAVFWLLRLSASSPAAPPYTVAIAAAALPRGDLNRVLGAPPVVANPAQAQAEPALATRFKLLGVAAPREGGNRFGLALIAVDGKPARSYKVGAPIEGDMVLQTVHQRGAALGARGAAPQLNLELPPLAPPNTSSRPPGMLPGAPQSSIGGPGSPGMLLGAPQSSTGGPGSPGGGPIATLPAPVAGVPQNSETQEPVLVPPPPGLSPSGAQVR
jgi:general secretion pathway protein C